MIGARVIVKRNSRDEAEKPFWISFADLMTALMVLFLVVMGVALLAVTKKPAEREAKEKQYREDIVKIMERCTVAAKSYDGITVDSEKHVIDFGPKAYFEFGQWVLTGEQEEYLRAFVPELLACANDAPGPKLLKRIVVEGYTDKTGTYLSNMNLSLQRSQRVLCAMFATTGQNLLSENQKESVRSLFILGGYSFNAAKDTDEGSRRVEMQLEFLGIDEAPSHVSVEPGNFGECALR